MSETKSAILPPNCYMVSVEGVGEFVFRRQTVRVAIDIQKDKVPNDIIGELDLAERTLRLVTVAAPAGWSLDDPDYIDPFDPDDIAKLLLVFRRLCEEEKKIREAKRKQRESARIGA